MAIQGGAPIRGGQVNGLNALQQGGGEGQSQQIQQLAQKILEMLQGGKGETKAAKGSQQAKAQGDGEQGESLEDLFRKLQELAQQNPEAMRAALQNPAVQQVAQIALSGGGGGGSVGRAA
jgi:hypothetical protein